MVPVALFLLAWCLVHTPIAFADPAFPQLTGRVVDDAGLLSAGDKTEITKQLESLETRTTDQLVLVTLPSLQGYPIEEFGYRLGRHWAIGQKDKNNGVLLIVAPNERKVRIEVGRGLEGVMPDAIAKIIIENAILPRFRTGDFTGGIKAGLRDIELVLTGDAEEVKARARRTATEDDWVATLILIVWIAIFVIVVWSIIQSAKHGAKSSARRGSSSGGPFWGGSSGGGWSGGGGGGFSGGGGGFGGGGASGGW